MLLVVDIVFICCMGHKQVFLNCKVVFVIGFLHGFAHKNPEKNLVPCAWRLTLKVVWYHFVL